jgi:putative NADH-flavin reductase
MNLLIFGSTGKTGLQLISQGLEQGHAITAFARSPNKLSTFAGRVKIVQGDVQDTIGVETAVRGQDVVLSALGVLKLSANTILSDGTKNIVAAMEKHGPKRFICMSSLGVGDSEGELGWAYNLIALPLFLRTVFADKLVQERAISESRLDWIIVRPAGLTNDARTGAYRVGAQNPRHIRMPKISRADVADFMLKNLTSTEYLRKTISLFY